MDLSINANNTSNSPFLNLPPEIRDQIYSYLFANKTIHIQGRNLRDGEEHLFTWRLYHPSGTFNDENIGKRVAHAICRCPSDSEELAYSVSTDIDIPDDAPKSCYYRARHRQCVIKMPKFYYPWDHDHSWKPESEDEIEVARYLEMRSPHPSDSDGLDFALLRVCRQIYDEAALIPYESNTFAFKELLDLDCFVSRVLYPKQREALTSIEVANAEEKFYGDKYALFGPETTRMLKGLERLSLHYPPGDVKLDERCGVLAFCDLALGRVRVTISPDRGSVRCSKGERRARARELERTLMG